MKTFRMIGIALVAVLIGMNFTACNSSNEEPEINGEDIITNEKKLISLEEEYVDDGDLYTYSFAYDNKNRVISVTTKDFHYDTPIIKVTNIEWKENVIVESRSGENLTLTLANGRVIKGESSEENSCNYAFAYDSSKRLSTSEHYHSDDYDNSSCSYSWDNDKLIKYIYSDDYDYEETQIKYNAQTCKGFFPLWGWLVEDDSYSFLAHPELIGFRNNYLPAQIIETNEDIVYVSNLAYTFDKDGYIESCIKTSIDGGEDETIVYTFKWQ